MNSIRHFLTTANAITSAGLAAGFLALLATIDAQILQATIWVIVAAVLDSLDGAVARRRNDDHALGTSLAFLLGAAWRLARFPLVKRYDCFLGMPMPVAGVLLMIFLLWRPAPELALIITGAITALLVSTLPFPTLQRIYRTTRNTRRGHSRGRSQRR